MEPEIEFGPDGQPTAGSWVAIEDAARAGDAVSMANLGLALHERGQRAEGLLWGDPYAMEYAARILAPRHRPGRQARTWLSLTDLGRQNFTDHVQALRAITAQQ